MTTDLTPESLAALDALAAAAAPGPWRTSIVEGEVWVDRDVDLQPKAHLIATTATRLNPASSAHAAYIAAADPSTVRALIAAHNRLAQWKAEALTVLAEWEETWEAAGRPGALGESKAVAVRAALTEARAEVEHWKVRAEANAEIDRRAGMLARAEAERDDARAALARLTDPDVSLVAAVINELAGAVDDIDEGHRPDHCAMCLTAMANAALTAVAREVTP